MSRFENNKYKETTPEKTLLLLRNILTDMAIQVKEAWQDTGVPNCYSVRLSIKGTPLGTNGKGTSREYALASGYAELFERIQGKILYQGDYSLRASREHGFYVYPDEKFLSAEDILAMDCEWHDILLKPLLSDSLSLVLKSLDFDAKTRKLEGIKRWRYNTLETDREKDFIALPFYSIKHKDLSYIPISILRTAYGSNGMCAGNTLEEALVQGISENMERYANRHIVENELTLKFLLALDSIALILARTSFGRIVFEPNR